MSFKEPGLLEVELLIMSYKINTLNTKISPIHLQ